MKAPFAFLKSSGGGGGGGLPTLTAWWRDFTAAPWLGTTSAGTSGSHELDHFSSDPASVSQNGHTAASFDGSGNFLRTADAYDQFGDASEASWLIFFRASSASANANGGGAPYANPALLASNNSGPFSITYCDAGLQVGYYDGSVYVETPYGPGVEATQIDDHVVGVKYDGVDLKIRVDKGPWVSTAGAAPWSSLAAQQLHIGANFAPSAFFHGKIQEIRGSNVAEDDATFDAWIADIEDRYSLTIPDYPTISSLSSDVGDPGGGYDVVITGTNFGTTEDVTFDGASAAGFSVGGGGTTITATVPSGSGTVDVKVITAGGTATAAGAFEYWSPATLAPKAFWDKPDYSLDGSSVGLWTPNTYNGLGSGTMNAGGAGTSPDVDTGGMPHFVAANHDALGLAGGNAIGQLLGSTEGTMLAVVNVDSIAGTDGTTVYNNDQICGDSLAYAGLYLGGSGSNKAILYWYDGSVKKAAVTAGTSGRMVIAAKNDSGTLKITVDGASFTTGDTGVGALGGSSGFLMGFGAFGGLPLNARLECLVMDSVAWSDADIAKFYKWAATRHP